jgi:hypothetical protein
VIYTIQGWLKGVNSEMLNTSEDMGKDSYQGTQYSYAGASTANPHHYVPSDAYGFSLNYFSGDYSKINSSIPNPIKDKSAINAITDLYNGNISAMATTYDKDGTCIIKPQLAVYSYDQLNRIKQMQSFTPQASNTSWSTTSAGYSSSVSTIKFVY